MTEKIAAVVVTYNRKKLLAECLDALLSETRPLNKIILIDNGSTDNTPEFLKEKGYLENPCIDYIRLSENTGGAGGFHEGVKYACEAGYDWLWLMDDDAEPEKDALEKLSQYLSEPNVSALANLKLDQKGHVISTHLGFINQQDKDYFDFESEIFREVEYQKIKNLKYLELSFTSFVGILINKHAVEKIGLPRRDFFIHFDDIEYCLRLINAGRILLIPSSVIIHKDAAYQTSVERKFLGKTWHRTAYNKLWLSYYQTRNLVWLRKKYIKKIDFYTRILKNYFRSLIGILLFDDNKFKRIQFLTEAYRDGIEGKFDNFKPKGILYGKT